MTAKPRILLVGAGRFGSEHLLEWNKLAAEGVVTLSGIAVATERSRDALQKRTGLPVHAPFTDDLLAHVDAVDLATPSATHAALVRRCLPRVHVLVEKPLAPTPEEARELGEIANRAGRVLMVGHVYRYHPVVRKLAELVAAIPERPRAIHGVLVNPHEDGVEHLDINLELLHPFDIIDYLFGAKPTVSIGRRRNLTHRVSLRYPGPMHAVLRLGWQGAQKIRTLDLSYADRQIRCNFVDNSIVISTRADQVEKLFFPHEHGALAQQFRAFVGAISGKSDEKYPDAEVSARVVEVARRSTPRAEPGRPRVAVVGGGIFGATCALELAKTCDVTLYERHSSLMTEVSFLNQWRHHSGFHYPRSYDTIQEIKAAKGTFEAEYGEAIVRRYPSYFCTSNTGVEIPAERYLAAVQGNNLNFSIQAPPAQVLDHSTVSISLKSDEAVYDYPKLKHIVEQRLNANPRIKVMLRTAVVDADIAADGSKVLKLESADKRGPTTESFDYLINATYANLNLVAKWFGFPVEPLRFDIYELLVLRIPIPQICVTIMDGPFTSLVGMGFDDMFMLSHIHDSVLRSVITEDGLPPKWESIRSNRENMLRHSSRYLPILKQATVLESRYATRTVNAYARDFDARPTVVRSHGFGVWSVLGGKILTCVTNAREIASEIMAEREDLSLRSIA